MTRNRARALRRKILTIADEGVRFTIATVQGRHPEEQPRAIVRVLLELRDAGRLLTDGGGPRQALYFRRPDGLL